MNYKTALSGACITGILLMSPVAFAISPATSLPLSNGDNAFSYWNGVGKLEETGGLSCTASLLDTRNANNEAVGPAYVLTAGHCVTLRPGPTTDLPIAGSVTFNYFHDTPSSHKTYGLQTAKWSTLRNTDFAIIELQASLASLLEDGITPLKLVADSASAVGDMHMLSALGAAAPSGLYQSSCYQSATNAAVVESTGIFAGTLKNDCLGVSTGSSGSPMINAETGEIASVLFSSTEGGSADSMCFWNTPCEVINTQPTFPLNRQYSHNVNDLAGCFADGSFNKDLAACSLNDGPTIRLKNYFSACYTNTPTAQEKTPSWSAELELNTPFYRFKSVNDATTCHVADNYSAAISSVNARIDEPVARQAGLYFLCVAGVASAEQELTPATLKDIRIFSAHLVEKVPARQPELTFNRTSNDGYQVIFKRDLPLFFNDYYYAGPANQTDCANIQREAYQYVGGAVTFEADQLPLTLCSYNVTLNMEKSSVRTDQLLAH